jgi:hypothetical protein
MLTNGEHTESFLGYVKVLINVCSANSGYYLTARGDPLYKKLWKKMSNFMMNTKELGKEQVTYAEFRVPLLLFHLMYILDLGRDSQILLWGMRNGQAYAEKCFEMCIDNPDHKIAATALDDLSGFFLTLFSQVRHRMAMCKTDEGVYPSDLGILTAFVEETKELENRTVALSQTVLHLLQQKMEVKGFNCEYLDRVISLCAVLIPHFIPSMEIQGTCRVSLKKLEFQGQCAREIIEYPFLCPFIFYREPSRLSMGLPRPVQFPKIKRNNNEFLVGQFLE